MASHTRPYPGGKLNNRPPMLSLLRFLILPILLSATVLPVSAQEWALPKVSVAILRSEPRHGAEQVSQVVMGTPLKVIRRQGDWWKIETPEGYTGYVRDNTLQGFGDAAMAEWRKAPRAVVLTDRTVYAMQVPSATPGAMRMTDLVNGSIIEIVPEEGTGEMTAIRLPDGRKGYVENRLLMPVEEWAGQDWNPADMPDYASRMMGVPYVWGGTSLKGMDCSGLTQICAYRQGILLPRDASQQVKAGIPVDKGDPSGFEAGDLLFFGNVNTGRITHVAISMGGPAYIHSSGRVRVSSLDESAPDYENPGLIAVRRIDSQNAISLSLRDHPWYF